MRTCVWVLFFVISMPCFAKGEAQIDRFAPWFDALIPILQTKNEEKAADALIKEEARGATFQLQALAVIYGFKEMEEDFQDLEDAIGEYEKWDKIYDKAKSDKKKKEVAEKREKGKEELVKLLKKKDWCGKKSRLKDWREYIENFGWAGYSTDKEQVLKALTKHLKGLGETEFDMTILEHGDGLHELRREVRWFTIMAQVVNGLVQFREDKTDCPVPALASLVTSKHADSKFAKLAAGKHEKEPCLVSQCLFVGFSKFIKELGDLKDEAEAAVELSGDKSDRVPDGVDKKAQALYDELLERNLVSEMRDQIKACY